MWNRLIYFIFKTSSSDPELFHMQPQKNKIQSNLKEKQGSTTNNRPLDIYIPVLPSFVHVFMLLHHDRVSCWDINDDPDWEEIMVSLLKTYLL